MTKRKYTFIDLFAGCGGLSEGFLSTGKFEALAHVEWESPMVDTLRNRLVQKWGHSKEDAEKRVIQFDVQKAEELMRGNWSEESIISYGDRNNAYTIKYGIDGLVENKTVDLIIGGPPCQAYSLCGRAQDPNSMKDDYRNYLFESFVKIVDRYQPKMFVFENVPGLLSACPGNRPVKDRIYEAFKKIGYEIRTPERLAEAVYCAADFETPQKRNRIIIMGVKEGGDISLDQLYESLSSQKMLTKQRTVRDAIEMLPKFHPLKEPTKRGKCNVSHEQIGTEKVSKHEARYHSSRDIKVFKEWLDKGLNNVSTQERLDFYTKITGKKSNHIKYRNLEWDKPSPTIVAHLHKDGLMFIHPDNNQLRSITIREAALLQSFPLDYEFLGSNAYCFKMIGNAVPVAFAKNIANAIHKVLK